MSEQSSPGMFLNPRQLANAFRGDRVPERTKYHLLLLGSIGQLVFGQPFLARARTWSSAQSVVITVAIVIWGIRSCYKANSRGDGGGFVERYICLSVPISIYATLAYFIAAFIIPSAAGTDGSSGRSASAWAWFGLSIGMNVVVYLALRYFVGVAAGAPVSRGDRTDA